MTSGHLEFNTSQVENSFSHSPKWVFIWSLPSSNASLWDSPGQNTGVGSLSLPQGIFPTQGLNPGLLHCRRILYQQGSPIKRHQHPNELLRLETFLAPQVTSLRSLGLSLSLCLHHWAEYVYPRPPACSLPFCTHTPGWPDTHRSVSSSSSQGSVARWWRQAGVNLAFVFLYF